MGGLAPRPSCRGWQLWRYFSLFGKRLVGVEFPAPPARALALARCKRGLQQRDQPVFFFCGVVFSLPSWQYKKPSSRSIFFLSSLLAGNSSTRAHQSLGWVPRRLQPLGGREPSFPLPGRAPFRSESPDSDLLPYLLPFSSLWVSGRYRRAAFPVGSLPIRVLQEIPLHFFALFEVPPAFEGLGICLCLSGSRRALSLPR